MKNLDIHFRKLILTAALCLICVPLINASGETLSKEQMKEFLLGAKAKSITGTVITVDAGSTA